MRSKAADLMPLIRRVRYALQPDPHSCLDNFRSTSKPTTTLRNFQQRRQHSVTISGRWVITLALPEKCTLFGPDQLHGFHERFTTDIYPADFAFTPNWLAADERIDAWYHNMSSVNEAGSAEMTYQLEFDDEVGFHGIRRIFDYARSPEQLPFILVASFTHPHDPYIARQKWWDLYDHSQIDMPESIHQFC